MLVFVENIGHKYDFQGGGVVSHWVGGWFRSKEKKFQQIINPFTSDHVPHCRTERICLKLTFFVISP